MDVALVTRMWVLFSISLFQDVTSQDCLQHLQTCIAPAMNRSQWAAATPCGSPHIDECGFYQQAISCIVKNMTSCLQVNEVSSTLNDLRTAANRLCNSDLRCQQQLDGCLCVMQNASANPVQTCSLVDAFHTCVKQMGSCQREAAVRDVLTAYHLSGVYCQTGICTDALTCMGDLFANNNFFHTTSGAAAALSTRQLCLLSSSVFGCLDLPSCRLNRTFIQQINATFVDMCNEISSNAVSVDQCQHFVNCTQAFQQFPETFDTNDLKDPSQGALLATQILVNLTTLEFWCSYLIHSFTCISDNARVCGKPGLNTDLSRAHLTSARDMCSGPVVNLTTVTTLTTATSAANEANTVSRGTRSAAVRTPVLYVAVASLASAMFHRYG